MFASSASTSLSIVVDAAGNGSSCNNSAVGASTGSPSARKNLITSSILCCRNSLSSPQEAARCTSLANSAIESFNAFCTLTEGLTSTWVSVSLAMM